jgi:hypothetical protein
MANYLTGKTCYLSGPIQYALEEFWRAEPIHILTERFGINVFDPFADEKQAWSEEISEAKNKNDIHQLVYISKQFVRKDLGMVDRSDFLVAYLPVGIQTVGTIHEIINSNNSKKPTLLVVNSDNIADIPLWFFGFIPQRYMFAGWRNLYDYLQLVHDGKFNDDDRWHLPCGVI